MSARDGLGHASPVRACALARARGQALEVLAELGAIGLTLAAAYVSMAVDVVDRAAAAEFEIG